MIELCHEKGNEGKTISNSRTKTATDGMVTGIDLGLKDYVTCYNGTNSYSVQHPKWLKLHERNLRYQQKQLSRRKKGSNRRNKARLLVARVHEKLSNARQDFLHKLSRQITALSQVVVVENLNIKGMVKNRNPPAFGIPPIRGDVRGVQSGWGMFLNFLDYKLKHKGGVLVEIDRFFPSSKLCSNCGHKYEGLQLHEREWTCSACKTKHLRDDNAAKNIRLEGIRIIGVGSTLHGEDVRLATCS